MKTLHLHTKTVKKGQKVIRDLFDSTLRDDTTFHFLFEPDLVIRAKEEESIKEIRKYCKAHKIKIEEYYYPTEGKYREAKTSVMRSYQVRLLPLLNLFSKLSIEMEDQDRFSLYERITHLLFNMSGWEHNEEAIILQRLALGRMKVDAKFERKQKRILELI